MFDIDETGVNWLNTHVVAIGQRIVEGDLVVIVVLVRLVRLLFPDRANFGFLQHFTPVFAIQKRTGQRVEGSGTAGQRHARSRQGATGQAT